MHIVFFGDQHLESLGGAQVSMRLQRRYLERAGHTVSVVAPRMHSKASSGHASYVDTPSVPMTPDREYSMTWPSAKTDAFIDRAFAERPPIDLVHVQADFWGAITGHRFAERHGLPVVHTMHNRVDVGMAAVTPLHRQVLMGLNMWRRRSLRGIGDQAAGNDGWDFLRGIAQGSSAVTAPSAHFARRLEQHGVFPSVDVVWNGIDDDVLDATLAVCPQRSQNRRPRFVWLGRMSPEKRLISFVRAVVASKIDADIEIIGGGAQRKAAERIARGHDGIRFVGRLSYPDTLARIAAADALVQTSIGFETQGMTPFEAAALGTPTVVCDPDIAAELREGWWQVSDDSIAALSEALRTATDDIRAGVAPAPSSEVAETFRQSSRTQAMLSVYERVRGSE